jgi:hypothetical protein
MTERYSAGLLELAYLRSVERPLHRRMFDA